MCGCPYDEHHDYDEKWNPAPDYDPVVATHIGHPIYPDIFVCGKPVKRDDRDN